MTRVVITDTDLGDGDLEAEALGPDIELVLARARTEDDVIAAAQHADGLLVQWAPITSRVLSALPDVRAVVRYGVGLDNIDLESANRRGVRVSNVPDYCIDEVAEHALALICAAARRLTPLDRLTHDGRWAPDLAPIARPFAQDPVGIAGFGRIGQAVARRLLAVGFPVLAFDPIAEPTALPVRRVDTLADLAEQVNHLTLHMPAGDETTGICNEAVIHALGPTGHLVNTARGALVDEDALLAALEQGRLWRASLDVLAHEPPTGTSAALAAHPAVVVTPHVGYQSTQSARNLRFSAATRLRELLALDPAS